MRKKAIAIDFDGVIHDSETARPGQLGAPMHGAFETMQLLEDADYQIIIYSCRPAEQISTWLGTHYPRGKKHPQIAKEKPSAIAYIDDRAIRFTNWVDIKKHFV